MPNEQALIQQIISIGQAQINAMAPQEKAQIMHFRNMLQAQGYRLAQWWEVQDGSFLANQEAALPGVQILA
jgi:hypothetical protein